MLSSRRYDVAGFLSEEDLPFIKNSWAIFPYEDTLKDLLTAIKFHKKRWLIDAFDKSIRDASQIVTSEDTFDAIIPIPLSLSKTIEREFNQAEIIGRKFSESTRIPLLSRSLRKPHSSISQSQLGMQEREAHLYGVFSVRNPRQVAGKTILLVDDIITTGATAREAARALTKAGAKSVSLFTLARTELKK